MLCLGFTRVTRPRLGNTPANHSKHREEGDPGERNKKRIKEGIEGSKNALKEVDSFLIDCLRFENILKSVVS